MANLFAIGLTNAVVATMLAVVVWCVTRVWRHPPLVALLWTLLLVKLVTPPLIAIPWRFERSVANTTSPRNLSTERNGKAAIAAPSTQSPADTLRLSERIAIATTEPITPALESIHEADVPHESAPERAHLSNMAASEPLDWIAILAAMWLSGSAIWLPIAVGRLVRFHRALRHTEICPDDVTSWANEVAAKLGVASRFHLRVTDARLSPFVWPIGRPTIVLSRPLLAAMSREETKMLLAHELAHVKRKDHWLRWLELTVTAIYWWHPVAWWARHMIHKAEEQACDAWVVWAFPESAKRYASALFKAVQMMAEHRPRAPLVASRIGSTGNLKERIEDIMNATWTCRLTMRARIALLVSALAILPLSVQAVSEANEQPVEPTKENPAATTAKNSLPPLKQKTSVNAGANKNAAPSSSRVETTISSDEIDALREHVTFLEEQFKKQDALYRTGSRGGSADKRSITGYELAVAQVDLAVAEGSRDKAVAFCEQAEKFADESLKNVTASYEAGRTPLEVLLQTARSVSESKRRLARIRRSTDAAASGARPVERSAAMSELAQLASSSAPTRSIGMLQKMTAVKKEEYDRLATLAKDKVVSASELAKAKADYEYSIDELRQAQHTLEYRKALVDLANVEYQQAIAANKQAPNAVSEFEMRRLKIMVNLAEAKLKEVAE
jgi:beta-lactamase regulating signal transducer with metallopeptidase domain